MYEKQLIDKEEHRNYFVYMSNRGITETFPILTDDPHSIHERAYQEISMGYTSLLIYERMAVLQDDSWFAASTSSEFQAQHFRNFLFVQLGPDDDYVSYSAFEAASSYDTLDEAVEAGHQLMQKKRKLYPNRVFTVVCAAFLKSYNWH